MPSFLDQMAAGGPDIGDHAVVAHEDEAVEENIALSSGEVDLAIVQGDEIREFADCDGVRPAALAPPSLIASNNRLPVDFWAVANAALELSRRRWE